MNLPHPARILVYTAIAACALSIPEARAALLVYEPFDYSTTPVSDVDGDGKADLSGLNGGFGFGDAWIEALPGDVDPTTNAFDYIQAGSLGVPPESAGLWTSGNSFRSINASNLRITELQRNLANPIAATDGTSLWFSILVQKEVNHLPTGPRDRETFSILFFNANRSQVVTLHDSPTDFNYGLIGIEGGSQIVSADVGPALLEPDLLVVKFSFGAAGDTMELFVNPALGVEPTSPNASVSMPGNGLTDLGGITINTGDNLNYRTQWSFDEIRIGETYKDVTVPEPASGLLAAFGLGAAGLSRFRRRRVA